MHLAVLIRVFVRLPVDRRGGDRGHLRQRCGGCRRAPLSADCRLMAADGKMNHFTSLTPSPGSRRGALHLEAGPVTLSVMRLQFEKMQGIGNDFVVLEASDASLSLTPEQIRWIADRRFGVGCDQLLIADAPVNDGAHVAMRIFNADGSPAKQCGNGVRCFAQFVRDHGIVDADPVRIATEDRVMEASILADGEVRADMGAPVFEPAAIPMLAAERASSYVLRVAGKEFTIGAVSMGNPHAVLVADDIEAAPVSAVGQLIQGHEWFPKGVNVGFMQVVSRDHVRLRVYERGVGETLACGSGACAAAAVGIDRGLIDKRVRVDLRGGSLAIEWHGESAPMWMTGPAARVFGGEIEL